jgi:hypothetical protein
MREKLKEFDIHLLYDDGTDTGAVITNYKPAYPVYYRKGVRTISGYTQFQKTFKTDCMLEFTLAFPIKGESDEETQKNIETYLTFLNRYFERLTLINEFAVTYKGYIQEQFEQSTPVEGDIYYISVHLLCNHDVSGWTGDNNDL